MDKDFTINLGALIEAYNESAPKAELMGYLNGYQGLLLGKSIAIPPSVREKTDILYEYGGSPIGNSRVKLTNVKDCVKRGYVKEGEKIIKEGNLNDFGKLLHESWLEKKRLSSSISNSSIDGIYNRAFKNGALGGKLLGAGGGGFFLFYVLYEN